LGDLVAKAQQGARGETGARELLERETEMRNLSKKAKTIIAGAAIAGLASTGVAYAYWTTTGAGSGGATTQSENAAAFTVGTATFGSATLYPGGVAETQTIAVTNSGAATVALHGVTADILSSTFQVGCTAADYTVTGWTASSPGYVTLLAGAHQDVTVSVQMKDLNANQDGCQGQVLVLTTHAS
jgi:hypothetical protein